MERDVPVQITSISQLHQLLGLPKPLHPLFTVVDNTAMKVERGRLPKTFLFDFYKISYKKSKNGKIGYGQGYYDFDEGGMVFTAPHQRIVVDEDVEYQGFSLLFHPDFVRNHPLAGQLHGYGFFSYATHEGLYLSEKEQRTIMDLFKKMEEELQTNMDRFSQDLMLSYLEVLLHYSNRFYQRQFLTRKAVNHDLLTRMEQLLHQYFDTGETLNKGLPTVEYLAGELHLSPRYLSDMLRSLTGQGAQQHIHDKLIAKAKEHLAGNQLTVAEVAYQLGFERPQSFHKLFKKKTQQTPLEFKQGFYPN